MAKTTALDRIRHQLRSGTRADVVETRSGFLPREDDLRTRIQAFLDSTKDSQLPADLKLRSDVEAVLETLYGGSALSDLHADRNVLEAVVIADGSRPVFFISDDELELTGAGNGPYVDAAVNSQAMLTLAGRAVGRVENDFKLPPPGLDKWFEGTAFLVADGLAMTNRHVIERMVNEPMSTTGPFTLKADYWLNFKAQFPATTQLRFKIEGVVFAGDQYIGDGGDITRLDLALLELGSAEKPGDAKPAPLALDMSPLHTFQTIAVIGYPAAPRVYTGIGDPPPGFELPDVLQRLFGGKFGFKRCASGEVEAANGSYPEDTKKWTVKHDASTLGGNSGSPILRLGTATPQVSALHFSGLSRSANYGHVLEKLAADLRAHGVPC